MGRKKKEIQPKRCWDNICHYSSDISKVKNLNEIYRFVYFKPKECHIAQDRVEWVYFDISLDDLIQKDNDICKAAHQIAANYEFIARLRCTGIKDMFGNLIFEGDITECKLGTNNYEKGCVTYCESSGGYSKGYTSIGSYQKFTEIIGDIFTTPDLDWPKGSHLKNFGVDKLRELRYENT